MFGHYDCLLKIVFAELFVSIVQMTVRHLTMPHAEKKQIFKGTTSCRTFLSVNKQTILVQNMMKLIRLRGKFRKNKPI